MPTSWPAPSDYSAAIQNPQNCFDDAEMKQGVVQLDSMGVPAASSGNFAVVYKMEIGKRTYAVRCFIRPVTDQKQR